MQLSVKYAAWLLNVPLETMYRWIGQNSIPFSSVKGRYLFNRVELLEWATRMNLPLSTDVITRKKTSIAALTEFSDALNVGSVFYHVSGRGPEAISKAIVEHLKLSDDADRSFLADVFLASDSLGYNAVGSGIAIPHVRNPIIQHVPEPSITLCFMEQPFYMKAADGVPVHALFTIVSPSFNTHLFLLSRLVCLLGVPDVRSALVAQLPEQDLMNLVARIEREFMGELRTQP